MASMDGNPALTPEILGILTCISDGILIFNGHKILYRNAEAHLLLQQTENRLLDRLQFDNSVKNFNQLQLQLPENNRHVLINCLPIHWENEAAQVAIIKPMPVHNDDKLSDRSQTTQHLRRHIDQLFKSAGDGYWDWYIPTADVFFSAGWLQMLGYGPMDITSSFNTWINMIHPDDLGNFLCTWSDYMENPVADFSIEYRIRCRDNSYLWVEAHAIKEIDSNGEVVHLAGFHRNIHRRKQDEIRLKEYQEDLESLVTQRTLELEQANLKLIQMAHQDPLTRLQNRRGFDETLQKQLLLSRRNNTSMCLLLMDIDHFKSFNDSYGHQLGDECLKQVAQAIAQAVHRPGDFTGRIGGEEFVAILQDTSVSGAVKVAQNIQQRISRLTGLPPNSTTRHQVTLSIGIVSNTQTSQLDIIQLADKAMYAAKKNGRDQICYFSDDLESVSYVLNNAVV